MLKRNPKDYESYLTQDGLPDLRLSVFRHDPALIIGQALLDAVNMVFAEIGSNETKEESLKQQYPNGIMGTTTGRADMRLAPSRHDPALVAMQQCLENTRNTVKQIAINLNYIVGDKAPLPTLEDIFDSEFLPTDDIISKVEAAVPNYEIIRTSHEKKYGGQKAPPESSVRAVEESITPPAAKSSSRGGRRRSA